MMRLTLGQLKASRVPATLNIPSDDSRFVQIANEAQQRLLQRGRWHGTTWRIKICASNGCITWPRQVAAADAVIIGSTPIQSFDRWYEFLEAGPGLQDDGCGLKLVDRPGACVIADIANATSKVRFYPDNANDAGKEILVQGYDDSGQWVLTDDGAVNGETVTLEVPYVETTNYYTNVAGIQKAETKGAVRAYAYNTAVGTSMLIGVYEPDETLPWYRRSLIVGLADYAENQESGTASITAEVKLEHIPVKNDSDYFIIGNLPAMKDMMRSIVLSERQIHDESKLMEASALLELQEELKHYRGTNRIPTIRVQDPWIFGAGMIESAT